MLRKNKAFTLIELLVVISIIALLLSILMPSLTKVKQQARDVICRSNLKQWGVCTALYLNDNNDKFWFGTNTTIPNTDPDRDRYAWVNTLRPYYQDVIEIRFCPSAKRLPNGPATAGVKPSDEAWARPMPDAADDLLDYFSGSYGNNVQCTGAWPGTWQTRLNFEKGGMNNASNVPLFSDALSWGGYLFSGTETEGGHFSQPPEIEGLIIEMGTYVPTRVCINRHNLAVNVVFADYSVRKVGLKGLWKLKWNKVFDTRNAQTQEGAYWPDWMSRAKE